MNENEIDQLILFVIDDAFGQMDYTDPVSVEGSIRFWFEKQKRLTQSCVSKDSTQDCVK